MPTNILNLPAYAVTAFHENEHDYHVTAEAKQRIASCPHCCHSKVDGFGRREQMVRDLPMHGKRVGLYIDTRRYRCKSCSKTFYESLPDINDRRLMTNRLVDWVGRQAVKRTFARIAEEVGIVEGTVRLIFKDYVAELEKTVRFETPQWMGIDEIHLIKPRGVIANIQNNTIVELLPNRNKETVVRYLSQLEGKDNIQYVAMDMWVPYRDACTAVIPQAQIVIDKFHILKMANEALERVSKRLRESLTPKQRRALMHDRFVLLKRECDLTDEELLLLSGWGKNYPQIGLAHRLKETFFGIYDAESPDEAQALYIDWKRQLVPEVADAFSDLIRAWENWQPLILAYFDHPVTNAYTESLNNLIRVINRLGRGYSFEALRAKILFAEGAHKYKNSRPKFERREQPQHAASEQLSHNPTFALVAGGIDTGNIRMFDMFVRKPATVNGSGRQSTSSSAQPEYPEKCYGVDISTLTKMLEDGTI
jgi:transposase